MTTLNQLTQKDAQALFDYRDGTLYWRHAGSGRRRDLLAVTKSAKRVQINIGGVKHEARYIVWNWHHGITHRTIVAANGDPHDIRIENLREIEIISTRFAPSRHTCPCCNQRVAVPSMEIVIDACKVRPIEAKILRAVWRGNGHPVTTQRIFDAMYEDDPDGGPEPQKMYSAFKIALCHLRKRLEGSGVAIRNEGYGRGYRLVMGADDVQ